MRRLYVTIWSPVKCPLASLRHFGPVAKRKQRQRRKAPAATVDYTDADGNVLTLRQSLSRGTIAKLAGPPRAGASLEDAWRRREELLFERLTARREIAGLR